MPELGRPAPATPPAQRRKAGGNRRLEEREPTEGRDACAHVGGDSGPESSMRRELGRLAQAIQQLAAAMSAAQREGCPSHAATLFELQRAV